MEYTQNYALRKPGLNEYANVGDLNFNADKIDSQMKKNQDVDGEVYDPTSTAANAYEAGDYVINPEDGLMYVCNGTTYGTWDATKWEHTTEFEELQKAMASGGESELADLNDVDLTNPTDGQILTYDDQNDEWVNSDLPDADVTKTASGNPIEFTDGADAPLVKCTTTIQGYQEGTGTPSPDNVRPIHAYTESTISVGGKNLFDNTNITEGSNIAVVSGDTVTNTSSTAWSAIRFRFNLKAGNYTFSYDTITGTGILQLSRWNGSSYVSIVEFNQSSTTKYRSITLSNDSVMRVSIYPIVANTTVSVKQIMLNTGSSAENYEPYKGTTHTATFSQSIYRGNADFVGGSASGEWIVIDLGDLNYILSTNFQADTQLPGTGVGYTDCICEQYVTHNVPGGEMILGDMKIQDRFLYIRDTRYNDATAFKAAVTGVKLAYRLAGPTTEQLTVSNLPIKSLFGYNHIESSTGEMEIEYITQGYQPLVDLIPEASNMHEYSTAEHAVGTWVDGSTIYERSIDLGSFSIGSEGTYIIEQATDIDLLIDYDGYVIENSIMYALPDPSIRIKMDSNKDLIFSGTASWYVSSGYLTIRYTKTASNNRSLAKSAPQEETKEEQVEELKEEPTEEIKEELKEEVKEEPKEEVEEVKEEETKEEGEVNER